LKKGNFYFIGGILIEGIALLSVTFLFHKTLFGGFVGLGLFFLGSRLLRNGVKLYDVKNSKLILGSTNQNKPYYWLLFKQTMFLHLVEFLILILMIFKIL
jgi:hypothetical protein